MVTDIGAGEGAGTDTRKRRTVVGRPRSSNRTPREDDGLSWATSDGVRRRMQRQRTRDTGPEIAVRRLVHAAGLRYRVDACPLPGVRRRADMVFRPDRVAVFIDGCFWHGCPEHGRRTYGKNTWYWPEKIERNRARDADTDSLLSEAGWLVLRVWEHERAEDAARLVIETVGTRRALRGKIIGKIIPHSSHRPEPPSPHQEG
jgi:DNA mismatch endonuclease (patch repair protein)